MLTAAQKTMQRTTSVTVGLLFVAALAAAAVLAWVVYARRLGELAIQHRMPAISAYDVFARSGGLLAYGARYEEQAIRAAALIDRIVKGASPADLPVEQPTRFALVVNLRTAKALGLTMPDSILLRADEVIE